MSAVLRQRTVFRLLLGVAAVVAASGCGTQSSGSVLAAASAGPSAAPPPVVHSTTAFFTPGAVELEACVGVSNGVCRTVQDRNEIARIIDSANAAPQEQLPISGCPNQDGLVVLVELRYADKSTEAAHAYAGKCPVIGRVDAAPRYPHVRAPEAANAIFALVGVKPGMTADQAPRNYTMLNEDRLRDAALRAAERNGDTHPRTIEWVKTTESDANSLMSGSTVGGPTGSRRVYLVQVTGTFVVHHGAPAVSAPGAGTTRGSVIWFTIQDNGESLSFGVQNERQDLTTLGSVHSEEREQVPKLRLRLY